jgi:hypothetical protein
MLASGCDSAGPSEASEADLGRGRGSIVSWQALETLSIAEIDAMGFPVVSQHEVSIVRVHYRTVDSRGDSTVASGAIVYPLSGNAFPFLSYQHGTVLEKVDVPSRGSSTYETLVGVAFATSGYLVAMPDYLGLGVSPGLHPFVHAGTLASSVIDMIRAARTFARVNEIELGPEVFLAGYSEGGYATMAAQRQIEQFHSSEISLTASAPMAGPYSLAGSMVGLVVSTTPYAQPYYLPYLLLAYNSVYGWYDDPSVILADPYRAVVSMYDGEHASGDINRLLPSVLREILEPQLLADFEGDATHPIRVALIQNDMTDWAPAAPMRLYHCTNDPLIPFENTEVALASFDERGAPDVEIVALTAPSHAACAGPSLALAKFWFDSFRQPAKRLEPPTPWPIQWSDE